MQTSELVRLTVKELQKFATDLGSTESSGLRKQELIKEILSSDPKSNIDDMVKFYKAQLKNPKLSRKHRTKVIKLLQTCAFFNLP